MSDVIQEKRYRVAVTAAGCLCPLGETEEQILQSLLDAKNCVTPVTQFDVSRCQCRTAGQIPDDWLKIAAAIFRKAGRWNRASQMNTIALARALEKIPDRSFDAIVVGTTAGGMSLGEQFYRLMAQAAQGRKGASLARSYVAQQPLVDAMEATGVQGRYTILSNACASGTSALGHAWHLIQSGQANRVLCGGFDAISELVYAGFDCLKASTSDYCRPFDAHRSGLVLGEGAAFFVLERWPTTDHPPLAEFLGFGAATDNYHLTQPDPSGLGPRLSMERALKAARLRPEAIDYVNAHGTATPFNDLSEGRALGQLLPHTPVSSSKGQMGHSLGAAGAIEAYFCLLALRHGFLPANLNFTTPDPEIPLALVANRTKPQALRHVLSNSFGFGGANASLILSQP